jgi:amino acid transporter/CBS domain-containing protein
MVEEAASKNDLARTLSFKDLFFLSFGGMSPLLSILTYGAFAITLAGYDAPLVMVIGTLLVLLNGLSVTRLSRRFSSSGGYYTYAFQALSARIGFDTGWMYIFYSFLYGIAYVMGAIFILHLVFGISVFIALAIIVIPSVTFLIIGIRLSSRYALVAVVIEIVTMIAIIAASFVVTKGAAYVPNPSVYPITPGDLFLGILFAMGIPTGYGSIAPVSGEVKNPKKDVGNSVITVILTGGILATVMIYAFSNLILQASLVIPVTEKLPIIRLLKNNLGSFGIYFYYAVAIATINDAILAFLSFGSAASRTIFRMGVDRSFPAFFGKKDRRNAPLVAILFTSLVMVTLPLIMLDYISAETGFIILGTISALGGLFIHISANFSLIRIGLRRGRRLALKVKNTFLDRSRNYDEFILAVTCASISSVVMIYSAYSTVSAYTTIFLTWIVIGFILSEVKSIVTKTPYDLDLSREGQMVAQNLETLTINDKSVNTIEAIYGLDDTVKTVIDGLIRKHTPYAIIVDANRYPVGVANIVDLLFLPEKTARVMKMRSVLLEKAISIEEHRKVSEGLRILKENNVNILAVVDDKGRCIGSVSDREVLFGLGTAVRDITT